MRPELRQVARGGAALGRRALRRVDRRRRAGATRRLETDLLRASGIFDQAWVELQMRTTFASAEEAMTAWFGRHLFCSPHPLVHHQWLRQGRGPRPEADANAVLWYLRNPDVQQSCAPHPFVDPRRLADERADLVDAEPGLVAAWIAQVDDDTVLPTPAHLPEMTYGDLRRASERGVREHNDGYQLDRAPRRTRRRMSGLVSAADVPALPPGDHPLVTVVIPVRNRAALLRAAVESVQAQSWERWELVVVDDGSDDDTAAVAQGLATFDDRVRVLREPRRGVAAARNAGVATASTTYVAFLDSDNTWEPEFLEVMLSRMVADDLAMAHGILRATRDGEVSHRALEGTRAHLMLANHVDLNVLVARRDAVVEVGGFDETLRRGVDWDLVLKLAAEHPLRLVPYVGVDYSDTGSDSGRISNTEASRWLSVVAGRHLTDWDAAAAQPREAGLVSVVVPVTGSLPTVLDSLSQLARRERTEVVLVGEALQRWQLVVLHVAAAALPRARVVNRPRSQGLAVALDAGLLEAQGEVAVLTSAPDQLVGGHLDDLVAPLQDPAIGLVQPVVLAPDDTIAAAGAVFGSDQPAPVPFLAGHALEDTSRLRPGPVRLPAAWSPVAAVRASAVVAAGGLDALVADELITTELSLRLGAAGLDSVLQPAALARSATGLQPDDDALARSLPVLARQHPTAPAGSPDLWRAAGLEAVAFETRRLHPLTASDDVVRTSRVVQPVLRRPPAAEVTEGRPRLRWTIDLASPAGPRGELWGDTHFGECLATALRDLGQHVAVDRREARHRASRDLDDVVLVLRGLDDVRPWPRAVNLQWIISHPDLVTRDEVASFDRVFSAGVRWATTRSAEWDVRIDPLLQATDPDRFAPHLGLFDTGDPVLFVGNSRQVFRDSVKLAIDAGLDVAVYGTGWQGMLPAGTVRAAYVANAEVGRAYAAAGVVLNDHWADMRSGGFVSNRLLDAAASGARIASDPVAGVDLDEMFGGLVVTWDSAASLREVVDHHRTAFPDAESRVAAAERIRREHSFAARARVLLDAALEAGAGR